MTPAPLHTVDLPAATAAQTDASVDTLAALAPLEQVRRLRTEIPGPLSRRAHAHRATQLPPGLGTTLPVYLERIDRGVLLDIDGNQLIDLASGIAVTSVGASAPRVRAAVAEQAARFTHSCFLVTPYQGYVEVAQWLNEHSPISGATTTALFSTGAEAVENAVKIARAHTGRPGVVVFDNAFHGRTLMTLAMTAKESYKIGVGPLPGDVHRAPFPTALRWPSGPEHATQEALAALDDLIARVGADNIAALVIEPIQGEGGFLTPTDGFLPGVQERARDHGIVFVLDEIQAGIGRTGTWFAAEHEALDPDLVTTAKALGGGMPLSAVTGRTEIMDAIAAGGLGGTYAGNPVACAAALAALRTIEEEGLLGAAHRIEQVARDVLEPLVRSQAHVAEVRGRGAMLAVEFVQPGSLDPAPQTAAAVAAAAHRSGVLVLTCGTYGNVVRLLPPLVIDEDLLRDGLNVLADAIRDAS